MAHVACNTDVPGSQDLYASRSSITQETFNYDAWDKHERKGQQDTSFEWLEMSKAGGARWYMECGCHVSLDKTPSLV